MDHTMTLTGEVRGYNQEQLKQHAEKAVEAYYDNHPCAAYTLHDETLHDTDYMRNGKELRIISIMYRAEFTASLKHTSNFKDGKLICTRCGEETGKR